MLDYLPAIIALSALMFSVRGGTWDHKQRGLRHITKIGWLSLGLGIAACIVSLIQTYTSERKQEWQEQQKAEVRAIAEGELHESILSMFSPFEKLYWNIMYEFPTLPQCDSCFRDHNAFSTWLTTPAIMEKFYHYYINDSPKWPEDDRTWGNLFYSNTKEVLADMERTLEKYSMYLDAETMTDVKRLEMHEFTQSTLIFNIGSNLKYHDSIGFLFFLSREKEPYLDFIQLTNTLIKRLQYPRWREEEDEKVNRYYDRNYNKGQ
jgi:hypothetical protein